MQKTIKQLLHYVQNSEKVPEYYESRNEGRKKRKWDAAYQV